MATRKSGSAQASKKRAKPKAAAVPRRPGRRWLRESFYWFSVLAVWLIVAVFGIIVWYAYDLPDVDQLHVVNRRPIVTLLDYTGKELDSFGDLYGEELRVETLPPVLPQAIIATEDRRYYQHFGIDLIGLARAAFANFTAGRVVQGGSTITQQLAKNVFLTPDRTIKRKVQEVLLALWLEYHFSKDDILSMYMNRVYLGAGTYGFDAAARKYFARSARDVTLQQAALLAGLLKAPSYYAPTRNLKRAQERAGVVISAMQDSGYIDSAAAQAARAAPARLQRRTLTRSGRYFADWVIERIPNYIGRLDSDVVVVTSIDPALQIAAEKLVEDAIQRNRAPLNVTESATVVLTHDGAVRAMVGGRSYRASQFNRATQARRQPGSAFKPFVFVAGLRQGFDPGDRIVDEPVNVEGWRPRNYRGKFYGPVTVRDAVAKSLNSVAVRISEASGRKNVAAIARQHGIRSPLKLHPSLALGASEVSLLELTNAYTPFANGGLATQAHGILEIRDNKGQILFQRPEVGNLVLSAGEVRDMNNMLTAVIDEGSGTGAKLNRPAAGKTGTSQNFRNAWFVGYTADFVAGVWSGNDNNSPTKGVTGGGLPARIWRDLMRIAHKEKAAKPLTTTPAGPAYDQISSTFVNLIDRVLNEITGSRLVPALPDVQDETSPTGNDGLEEIKAVDNHP